MSQLAYKVLISWMWHNSKNNNSYIVLYCFLILMHELSIYISIYLHVINLLQTILKYFLNIFCKTIQIINYKEYRNMSGFDNTFKNRRLLFRWESKLLFRAVNNWWNFMDRYTRRNGGTAYACSIMHKYPFRYWNALNFN